MRHLLLVGSVLSLMGGCAAVDRERADRHHEQAKHELKHGNVGHAIDEQKAANRARDDERHDRFQPEVSVDKLSIAERLREIGAWLSFHGDRSFRRRAYERAALAVEAIHDLDRLVAEGRLTEVPGIGPAIARAVEIYRRAGLPPIPPELREDAGEIEAAEAGDRFGDLIGPGDVRGMIHCHAVWSDGRHTIELSGDPWRLDLPSEHIPAARARGLRFVISGLTNSPAPSGRGSRMRPCR